MACAEQLHFFKSSISKQGLHYMDFIISLFCNLTVIAKKKSLLKMLCNLHSPKSLKKNKEGGGFPSHLRLNWLTRQNRRRLDLWSLVILASTEGFEVNKSVCEFLFSPRNLNFASVCSCRSCRELGLHRKTDVT